MAIHNDGIYYGKYKETEEGVHYRGRYTWGGIFQVIAGVVVIVVVVCALVVLTGAGTINLGTLVIGG